MKQLDVIFEENQPFLADLTNSDTFQSTFGVEVNKGPAGATYFPLVSEDGILSWENNRGLENPPPVNLGDSILIQVDEKLNNKVDKVPGMGLSSNDFSDTLLSKLNSIENGAQKNNTLIINGQPLIPTPNNEIIIPIGTENLPGLVSSNDNVLIDAATGGMTVNKVNISALQQDEDQDLFLDCGEIKNYKK